jgi:predicted metalloprotease
MYGESKYHDIEKMTTIIEDIIEETWSYLEGKNGEDEYKNGQLVLFAPRKQKPVLKKSA